MEYVVPLLLSFFAAIIIIFAINRKSKISPSSIMLRQSELHILLKDLFVVENKEKDSQLNRHLSKNSIKIMTIDEKSYWIANNIFYMADLIDGMPDFNNAVPVDTINMPQKELDKMMFILDNLRRGD
jgi:hypothetical protein